MAVDLRMLKGPFNIPGVTPLVAAEIVIQTFEFKKRDCKNEKCKHILDFALEVLINDDETSVYSNSKFSDLVKYIEKHPTVDVAVQTDNNKRSAEATEDNKCDKNSGINLLCKKPKLIPLISTDGNLCDPRMNIEPKNTHIYKRLSFESGYESDTNQQVRKIPETSIKGQSGINKSDSGIFQENPPFKTVTCVTEQTTNINTAGTIKESLINHQDLTHENEEVKPVKPQGLLFEKKIIHNDPRYKVKTNRHEVDSKLKTPLLDFNMAKPVPPLHSSNVNWSNVNPSSNPLRLPNTSQPPFFTHSGYNQSRFTQPYPSTGWSFSYQDTRNYNFQFYPYYQ